MRPTLLSTCILGALTAAACGGGDDPFAAGDDSPAAADAHLGGPDADPSAPDAAPARACATAPKRVVVVGDSITACSVIGGPQGANCVSKQLADYVIAHYAPGASYENYAVGGAQLADLPGQIASIPAGDGPMLLVAYMGGNDLAPYIFQSDAAAMAAWDDLSGEMRDTWDGVFATLGSDDRFADGVTVLMNTQYNPFDDCTAPPYNLSAAKIEILHMFNDTLGSIASGAGDRAILVHQFEPFLGHGHHYDVDTCPHYQAGATPFMQDTIHANADGNAQLAAVMEGGADRLYRDCTP
ncbi:MAG: SGNH/GDSL hydrolase family protein [Kofleriaceae bacterium]|nr:SGNH/GDSL hydrolase family protein [Kofleriaceae bacterium]MCB9571815.1 SGNH/GDSL hydrolase family protein [Kofleriaceae bacterium]